MPADVTEQYDNIYRYCYFKLKNRETAEDITQETFLRYLEHYACDSTEQALKCLYTIARNLCVDEYRRADVLPLPQQIWEEGRAAGISGKVAAAGERTAKQGGVGAATQNPDAAGF